MNPLTDMTGAEIAAAVKAGKLTARSVAEAALARTEKLNPVLNGFTAITSQRALAKADAVDADIAAGRDPGPLAGVPFAVKNLFDVKGLPTLAGSKINRDLPPAGDDAALVKRMEAAGAVLTGALNMGEYAYDFTGQNAHDGASRNPHDPEHKPYAIVQLRQDNRLGTLWNIVGFQTKLKYAAQVETFRAIPGLENAEFARLGGIHRREMLI